MVSFGLSVVARDGMLYVSPIEQITDALRAKIRANKPGLLALLSGAEPMPDNRRTCLDCMDLVRGQCRAAARGELPHAARGYEPIPDRLHRCLSYRPGPGDADRRVGYERYPGMSRKFAVRKSA
jgi:hypothetical protein